MAASEMDALRGAQRTAERALEDMARVRDELPGLCAAMLSLMISVHGPEASALWLRKRADEIEQEARAHGLWGGSELIARLRQLADEA